MSHLYIHENLVRIQPLVHKILCRQKSLTPAPTVSAPKNNMSPSPLVVGGVGGHKNLLKAWVQLLQIYVLQIKQIISFRGDPFSEERLKPFR